MPTLLEQLVNELNRAVFFREFSFSQNEFFWPTPGDKKEFADHAIWLNDSLIIFQVKERGAIDATSADAEKRWFEKTVIAKASKQVRDTIRFLETCPEITITNQHGQVRVLNASQVAKSKIIKIVLYLPSEFLPDDCLQRRCYISNSNGYSFLHLLSWPNYFTVCRTLITPAEFIEYFVFRQTLIERCLGHKAFPSESALIGQFLSGDSLGEPTEDFASHLYALRDDESEFDLGWLFQDFKEKIEFEQETEAFGGYQCILQEVAMLHRQELKAFKKRIDSCLAVLESGLYRLPTRFVSYRTGCGFLFFATNEASRAERVELLRVLIGFSQYQLKLNRHIGVMFYDRGENCSIEWCFSNHPYEFDPDLEAAMQEPNPFSPILDVEVERYEFDDNE